MTDQPHPDIPAAHLAALQTLVTGLGDAPILWALTGSLGFAVQGVPVAVHDIDLQTDREGAFAIERIFLANSVRKVVFSEKGKIRSYYGALEIEGVEVEIMGDLQKRLDSGVWEDPVDVARWRTWVSANGLRIPAMDLTYEYQAYKLMGRLERAELLNRWLAENRLAGSGLPRSG